MSDTDGAGDGAAGQAGSDRTRIRRNAKRARYELNEVRAVLDANQVCTVAYVEAGEPRMISTLYMRRGDYIYLHGNRQSAMLRHLLDGGQACVSVICVDGIVVARSGFNCSMNYRSVVLFGRGEALPEEDHEPVLEAFVEALVPGHLARVRRSTAAELNATAVVRLPISDASAKIRTGPALDDDRDLDADVWAGVIPLQIHAGTPVPNPDLKPGMDLPDYIRDYRPPS
ncbi:MAG: pyridoxamine 5'-phosphate oxidase family protein [Pseudomonadales bacterium]|nr:pyridoxamine 5'-phosphate oxidase family protein [Pseudomonadales bacterium]